MADELLTGLVDRIANVARTEAQLTLARVLYNIAKRATGPSIAVVDVLEAVTEMLGTLGEETARG